jgi:hypothetical protein
MLNMEVIYPSIDDMPESFRPEVPQGPPTQEETILEAHTLTNQSMVQADATPEIVQVPTAVNKTDQEQQTMVLPEQIQVWSDCVGRLTYFSVISQILYHWVTITRTYA